jgi:hypothetical protein
VERRGAGPARASVPCPGPSHHHGPPASVRGIGRTRRPESRRPVRGPSAPWAGAGPRVRRSSGPVGGPDDRSGGHAFHFGSDRSPGPGRPWRTRPVGRGDRGDVLQPALGGWDPGLWPRASLLEVGGAGPGRGAALGVDDRFGLAVQRSPRLLTGVRGVARTLGGAVRRVERGRDQDLLDSSDAQALGARSVQGAGALQIPEIRGVNHRIACNTGGDL